MNNNYNRMQEFLDVIKEFAIANPEKEITNDLVYSNLVRFYINSNSYLNVVQQNCYNDWKQRYKDTNNLTVDDNLQGDFCWFLNTYNISNAIKLYIPMDLVHIKEGANQLFDFISSTNMLHQSKIASSIRNDNVVVRVNSLEDAKQIVDFVSSNGYIQEGMLKVNPFTPNINGIGMTMDNNFSFNSELSKLLSVFIEWLKTENRLDLVTVEELNKFIKFQIDYISELDLKDIYILLSKTTSKDFKIDEFIEYTQNKLINDYDQERNRIVDPEHYLQKAILVTEKNHPGNSQKAILEYLKGNANYFTRKEKAREGLVKYVKPSNLISLITKKLSENGIMYAANQDDLIEKYLDIVLNRQKEQNNIVENQNNKNNVVQQNNYANEFEIIKTAFINTFNEYNNHQAVGAFKKIYLYNNPESFTNKYGDRTKLENLVKSYDVKKIILSNIDINGLHVTNVDAILERFISSINKNVNKKEL